MKGEVSPVNRENRGQPISLERSFRIYIQIYIRERSGSVVECLTWDRGAMGSSLTGITVLCPWARHINPSLVLVQPRKTRPFITERLLMGRKESNQRNKKQIYIIFNSLLVLLFIWWIFLFQTWIIIKYGNICLCCYISSEWVLWWQSLCKNGR